MINNIRDFAVDWLLQPTKKAVPQTKVTIIIYPRTPITTDSRGYYPVANSTSAATHCRYMILNEDKQCIDTTGNVVSDYYIAKGSTRYTIYPGTYYYYEVVADNGNELISDYVEINVGENDKYKYFYIDHDYSAIKIYYEEVWEDMYIELKDTYTWQEASRIKYVTYKNNSKRHIATKAYTVYTKIKSIKFQGKDYTDIVSLQENPNKDTVNEGSSGVTNSYDYESSMYSGDTYVFNYRDSDLIVPTYIINEQSFTPDHGTYSNARVAIYADDSSQRNDVTYCCGVQTDIEESHYTGNTLYENILKESSTYDILDIYDVKNGFGTLMDYRSPAIDITSVLYKTTPDGVTTTTDASKTVDETNYGDYGSAAFSWYRISSSDFLIAVYKAILEGKSLYTKTLQFVRIFEKNKHEYQTYRQAPRYSISETLAGVSDDEITDCFDVIIPQYQQAREGFEYLLT